MRGSRSRSARWRRWALSGLAVMALGNAGLGACGGDVADPCDGARRAQQKIDACLRDGYQLLPIAFETEPCKAEDDCFVGCVLRAPTCRSMACTALTDPNDPYLPDLAFCECVTQTCAK